jgi:hypothetical protein
MNFEEILHVGLDGLSSKEERKRLMDEAVRFFLEMKSKMESGDPEKREEAKERLANIAALLAARKSGLVAITGLTPSQFDAISRLGSEHEAVSEAKAKLEKIFKPESRRKPLKGGRLPG